MCYSEEPNAKIKYTVGWNAAHITDFCEMKMTMCFVGSLSLKSMTSLTNKKTLNRYVRHTEDSQN